MSSADDVVVALRALEGAGRNGAAAESSNLLPPPADPMAVARALAEAYYHSSGNWRLRHWRGGWWEWRTSRWIEIEDRAVKAKGYAFGEHAYYPDGGKLKPWQPNRHKIANLLDALAAISHLPESMNQPTWIDNRVTGPIVATANGLLDVASRKLLEHSPRFFNGTAVPFEYNPDAPEPERWHHFLRELWPNDSEQITALQEWFGYVVSGRLDLHKILLLVGPTRAGKGLISRILGALIGPENVAGPTLSSLSGDFGLAPMLGKPLAVISDARLSGRDSSVVVERLLSISGEDAITVNRKYREQWTGKLPCRFMICSNELPQLGDASAAIAGRFVTLQLERTWLGSEDITLEDTLRGELPGILNWALDGLQSLTEHGRFVHPQSTEEAYRTLGDLASPVRAFVRDCCVIGPDQAIPVDELWKAWREWAEDNGHCKANKQMLGRNVRAALPQVQIRQLGAERIRNYWAPRCSEWVASGSVASLPGF